MCGAAAQQQQACEELAAQLQSPEGMSVPFCLVAERDEYEQIAFGEVNLQVWRVWVSEPHMAMQTIIYSTERGHCHAAGYP